MRRLERELSNESRPFQVPAPGSTSVESKNKSNARFLFGLLTPFSLSPSQTKKPNSTLAPRVGTSKVSGAAEIGIEEARGGQSAPEKRWDRIDSIVVAPHQRGTGAIAEENENGGEPPDAVGEESGSSAFCRPRHAQGPHGQARPSLDAASQEAQHKLRSRGVQEAARGSSSESGGDRSLGLPSCRCPSSGGFRPRQRRRPEPGRGPAAAAAAPLPAAAPSAPERVDRTRTRRKRSDGGRRRGGGEGPPLVV